MTTASHQQSGQRWARENGSHQAMIKALLPKLKMIP
jgi:hypothetical protein